MPRILRENPASRLLHPPVRPEHALDLRIPKNLNLVEEAQRNLLFSKNTNKVALLLTPDPTGKGYSFDNQHFYNITRITLHNVNSQSAAKDPASYQKDKALLDLHFSHLGEAHLGNSRLIIVGNKLYKEDSPEGLLRRPFLCIDSNFLPERRKAISEGEVLASIEYQRKMRILDAENFGQDFPSSLTGAGKVITGPRDCYQSFRRARAAWNTDFNHGLKENVLRCAMHAFSWISSTFSLILNGHRAVQFLRPEYLIVIPAALTTAVFVGTIFAIVVTALEGIEQAKKLYRQVSFSRSPYMQLANVLQKNPPPERCTPEQCKMFMRELSEVLQQFKIGNRESQNLATVTEINTLLKNLKDMTQIPELHDQQRKVFTQLNKLKDEDPKQFQQKIQLTEQSGALANEVEALWNKYPSTAMDKVNTAEALHQELYNTAATLLALSFREEYFSTAAKSIKIQNLVGVTMGQELDGYLLGMSRNSSEPNRNAKDIMQRAKTNPDATQIVATFEQLDQKASRKVVIHGVSLAICILIIASLGLTFATGVPAAVGGILFFVIFVAGLTNSLYLSRNFNEKSFRDYPIAEQALYDPFEAENYRPPGSKPALIIYPQDARAAWMGGNPNKVEEEDKKLKKIFKLAPCAYGRPGQRHRIHMADA